MKKLLFIALVSILFFSCVNEPDTPPAPVPSSHEAQWSSDSQDSVVYVSYRHQDGSFSNFYINYLLFNSLFRSGGYGACYNYYRSNPSGFAKQNDYKVYSSSYSPSAKAAAAREAATHTPSSPARKSSYSSPSSSRPYIGTSSTPTPSRSYSTPSRSYSSPSRSYSSPSRH